MSEAIILYRGRGGQDLTPTVITSNQTFTVPHSGNYSIYSVGGGGGGGGGCRNAWNSSQVYYGGAGTRGSLNTRTNLKLNQGDKIQVNIGAGGSAGVNNTTVVSNNSTGTNGGAGGTTTFGSYGSAAGGSRGNYSQYYKYWTTSISGWNNTILRWNNRVTAWNNVVTSWNNRITSWNNRVTAWNNVIVSWNNVVATWNNVNKGWNNTVTVYGTIDYAYLEQTSYWLATNRCLLPATWLYTIGGSCRKSVNGTQMTVYANMLLDFIDKPFCSDNMVYSGYGGIDTWYYIPCTISTATMASKYNFVLQSAGNNAWGNISVGVWDYGNYNYRPTRVGKVTNKIEWSNTPKTWKNTPTWSNTPKTWSNTPIWTNTPKTWKNTPKTWSNVPEWSNTPIWNNYWANSSTRCYTSIQIGSWWYINGKAVTTSGNRAYHGDGGNSGRPGNAGFVLIVPQSV